MESAAFDDAGWLIGQLKPWARDEALTLFASDASSALDQSALDARARGHGLSISVEPPKRYPAGATPIADAAWLLVAPLGKSVAARVAVTTFPVERAFDLREEALRVASTRGGAGMDALVRRARRVWQVRLGDDIQAALRVAAVLSAQRLGAILPADGGALFGPKTAWERAAG